MQKINKLSFTLIRCHKHIHGFSYFVVFPIKFSFKKVLLFVFPKIWYYFGFVKFISGCVGNIHNRMSRVNVRNTRTRHRDISEVTLSPYAGKSNKTFPNNTQLTQCYVTLNSAKLFRVNGATELPEIKTETEVSSTSAFPCILIRMQNNKRTTFLNFWLPEGNSLISTMLNDSALQRHWNEISWNTSCRMEYICGIQFENNPYSISGIRLALCIV